MSDVVDRREASLTRDARTIVHWAAELNLTAQENLLNQICVHQTDSGNDISVVAERLGISEEDTARALSGRIDLTLTELRELAIACDVVIEYEVTSSRVAFEYERTLRLFTARVVERDTGRAWKHHQSVGATTARYYLAKRA